MDKDGKDVKEVYDFMGDYVRNFYDPERDIIINPLDKRAVAEILQHTPKTDDVIGRVYEQ